jgi:hypothetical protein
VRPLVALRHRDRELLRARDLQAEFDDAARLRALHVRLVHGTWGIALGLTVGTTNAGRRVTVGPGFGYDCRGREIVSARRALLPLPTLEEPADLVLRAGCGGRFAWRAPGHACEDELVLARGYFKAGKVVELDPSVARWCRRHRFRVASGIYSAPPEQQLVVSTTTGTFDAVPLYFATVAVDGGTFAPALELRDETTEGFTAVLRAPQASFDANGGADIHVHWVGVEPLPGCAPSFRLEELIR